MVIEDLKEEMSLRNISRISGISLSGYYHLPEREHIQRLDPSIKASILNIASERPSRDTLMVYWIPQDKSKFCCC